MNLLKFLIVSLLLFQGHAIAQPGSDGYRYLMGYNGQYSYDVKLLEGKKLKQSLTLLLGPERLKFLTKYWNVENPMTVENGIFSAAACQQHNCSDTNFIIVVDIEANKLYVGIRENGKAKIYPAEASKQKQLIAWLSR